MKSGSKIVDTINEAEIELIETKRFTTKNNFWNFIGGAIVGKIGPKKRVNYRVKNYAQKIEADKITIFYSKGTIHHMPLNPRTDTGWSEPCFSGHVSFYKNKQ